MLFLFLSHLEPAGSQLNGVIPYCYCRAKQVLNLFPFLHRKMEPPSYKDPFQPIQAKWHQGS